MFEGKVVLITGGTRGIGYATVKRFLQEGAKVVLFGSSEASVSKALKNLKDVNESYEVTGLWPDLSSYKQVQTAIETIIKKYKAIDILINNAGVSDSKSFYDYTEQDFDYVMELNIKAIFNMTRCTVPYMKENNGGVILNTSSMVSIYGQPAGVAYPTSKFAVNGITKSLARELAKDHIRVNAVAPGVIHTDMVDSLSEEVRTGLIKSIPLGRMGEPEDIANAFAFLASDQASFITGSILSVDGAGMV